MKLQSTISLLSIAAVMTMATDNAIADSPPGVDAGPYTGFHRLQRTSTPGLNRRIPGEPVIDEADEIGINPVTGRTERIVGYCIFYNDIGEPIFVLSNTKSCSRLLNQMNRGVDHHWTLDY